jgi:hypothetical protein
MTQPATLANWRTPPLFGMGIHGQNLFVDRAVAEVREALAKA